MPDQLEVLLPVIVLVAVLALVLISVFGIGRMPDWAKKLHSEVEKSGGQQSLKLEDALRDEGRKQRKEANESAAALREEIQRQMKFLTDSNAERFKEIGELQKEQLDAFGRTMNQRLADTVEGQQKLTGALEKKQNELRDKLDEKLAALSKENSKKLDEMRQTVDEKLQSTLEKRLGESFKQVSERLEKVHQGLGEMQSLASNVGDLRRTLTNVKTRGTWAEIQLSILLEDMLAADQYIANAQIKKRSQERVEFAIKLPGKDDDGDSLLLPIDSKFPTEDYDRLVAASESGDPTAVEAASLALSRRITSFAKDISDKYIDPPTTTDFAIMYLPTEGLYAEVLRRPGLAADLQNKFRITVTGPTTISAFLSSLQMGFRTLAIEKRSSEVWQVLGAVKTEFGKFGDVLGKVKKKLQEANSHIESVGIRSRAITRKLKAVEEAPASEVQQLLGVDQDGDIDDADQSKD